MTLSELEATPEGSHFHCENDCDHAVFQECADGQLRCVHCKSGAMVLCTPEICMERRP